MKSVTAIVFLLAAACSQAWNPDLNPWLQRTSEPYDRDTYATIAVNTLINDELYDISDLVPKLYGIIDQYRTVPLTKKQFISAVRTLLYDRVYDRANVEKFLYTIVYQTPKAIKTPMYGNEVEAVDKVTPSRFGWNNGPIQTSRISGDTIVETGMIGGNGGDSINFVHNGVLQSGGGITDIISHVQGTNNQGVSRGSDFRSSLSEEEIAYIVSYLSPFPL